MRIQGSANVGVVVLLAVILGLVPVSIGWAQQAIPPAAGPAPSAAPADDSPGLTAMAAVAGVVGSFFYIPFKVGAICPALALASGGSLVVTGGDTATAGYLLRAGCAGTYFITPGMVRGQEEFQASGTR
ncbi:MAG TPA: hypothetical protein VGC81_08960 [Candidatus Methylomirabilis sp.]